MGTGNCRSKTLRPVFVLAPPTSLQWLDGLCLGLTHLSLPSAVHAAPAQPQAHVHAEETGSGLASTSSAPLVAPACGGLPRGRGRIWVQVCPSGGLLVIPLPTPLLPTQVQRFLLGLKNDLPSPSILDKKWPSAPYKCFSTANHELQRLFHQWKVSGAWAALLAPGQFLSPLPFFSSPSSDFPLLPPSSTQTFFLLLFMVVTHKIYHFNQ